jgi:hypothetical protein
VNYLTPVDRFLNDAAERGRIGRPSDECRIRYGRGQDRSKRNAVLIYRTHGRVIWLGKVERNLHSFHCLGQTPSRRMSYRRIGLVRLCNDCSSTRP